MTAIWDAVLLVEETGSFDAAFWARSLESMVERLLQPEPTSTDRRDAEETLRLFRLARAMHRVEALAG